MKTVEFTYRFEPSTAPTRAPPQDADAARRRLDDGNRAFASLLRDMSTGSGVQGRVMHVDARDLGIDDGHMGVPRQRPFAAVVGCADARVPVELVFNEGPNDLFVVRVAGNGMAGDVLGSLDYAVEHLAESLRAIVVLGHSGCGAISAAVEVFTAPSAYLPLVGNHALRGILDRFQTVVRASSNGLIEAYGPTVVDRPGYRAALTEVSVAMNACWGAYILREALLARGNVTVKPLHGTYLLQSRQVWAPDPSADDWHRLADAPADLADFRTFGEALVRAARIAALLEG